VRLVPFGLHAKAIVAVIDPAIADTIGRRFRGRTGSRAARDAGASGKRRERTHGEGDRDETWKRCHEDLLSPDDC
jgi:hypothetical protein